MKTSKIVVFLLLAALVMTFSPQRCLADLYSGTLSEYYGGITATDGWIATSETADTTLEWQITNYGSYLEYKYTFTTPMKALSHIIFEVSPNFTVDDYTDLSGLGGELRSPTETPTEPTWSSADSANPGMPWTIPGIKFDTGGSSSMVTVVTFNSTRLPTWGNFYAKDGQGPIPGGGTDWATAWNAVEDTVAVPDTVVPVPGAVLLGILGLGVAGLKLRKYA